MAKKMVYIWRLDRIDEVRRRRQMETGLDFSDQALAEAAGKHVLTVGRWRRGEVTEPQSAVPVKAIADLLGVPMSEFYEAVEVDDPGEDITAQIRRSVAAGHAIPA